MQLQSKTRKNFKKAIKFREIFTPVLQHSDSEHTKQTMRLK